MTKRDNKGFSLIEIIIAVAVMTILLAPIIQQLIQTLNTSAAAKERQLALENAEYVTEFFQKTEKTSLDDASTSDSMLDIASSSTRVVACRLMKVSDDGTSVADTGVTVNYTATVYELDDVQLGKKKTNYTRSVVLDDLNNKVMENSFQIDYSFESYTDKGNMVTGAGYTITRDGTAVKYDTNGFVSEVVVLPITAAVADPNMINLGHIQDLDTSKVAIIEGDESNLDSQFESDLISTMLADLDGLKSGYSDAEWTRYTNSLKTYLYAQKDVAAANDQISRAIIIKVKGVEDITGQLKYYNVTCSVHFEIVYQLSKGDKVPGSQNFSHSYEYDVFSHNFYTSKAPDVYMYYEPFVINTTNDAWQYLDKDFIYVEGDKYTAGGPLTKGEPSKIYLVKPNKTWQSEKIFAATTTPSALKSNVYYSYIGGRYTPIQVYLAQILSATDMVPPLKVYTNIGVVAETQDDGQVVNVISNELKAYNDAGVAAANTYKHFETGSVLATGPDVSKYLTGSSLVASMTVNPFDQDTRQTGRLYSITVTLEDEKGNLTTFTGAKGAD